MYVELSPEHQQCSSALGREYEHTGRRKITDQAHHSEGFRGGISRVSGREEGEEARVEARFWCGDREQVLASPNPVPPPSSNYQTARLDTVTTAYKTTSLCGGKALSGEDVHLRPGHDGDGFV